MLRIGLVGYGYWGPNLLRNFSANGNCSVTFLADSRPVRLEAAKKNLPSLQVTTDPLELIRSTETDAVVIATPVFTHYELAKAALNAGKHVLIEKPMTSTVAQAEELINLAAQKGLTLMVDHTFLYTGAVRKMRDMALNGELGNLQYFDSTRINLGLFQPDVNVIWDLAPHDISILHFILRERPVSVNATGVSHTGNGIENIAYLTLNYQSGFIAHFSSSWSSPVKLRTILLGGDKKMIVYNDLEPTEKIRVYDTGYSVRNDEEKKSLLVDYRTGDIHIPKLAMTEALAGVAADFIGSIMEKRNPVSDAQLGMDVIRILEASQKSIKTSGAEVKIA